jgi:signal transduction histidine kinase
VRGIFGKILFWFGVMLVVSFFGFSITTDLILRRANPMENLIGRLTRMQLDEAARAYESGGKAPLAASLDKYGRFFPGQHYLLDAQGRDLVSGDDRSALLNVPPPPPRFPLTQAPRGPITLASADGRYNLVIVANHLDFNPWTLLPYYAWIVLVIVLLSYALAVTMARPLRQLRLTLRKFGTGDLGIRTRSRRRDEFGDVSRTFDEMADRIQTLLTAERRLLQDVSHELRSPLARLGFAVELARTAEDRNAALDRINRDVNRLTNLVGELIQMTRAEGDPEARTSEPVQLSGLVQSVVDDNFIEADAGGCPINCRIESPATVQGDSELLRRAIENVLRNAIRHSPAGSPIEVNLRQNGSSAILLVRDHGPGVPPEVLSDIFRPFFRVDDHRARATGGVGLGLAIAQRAVQLHHGRISARNASPGLEVEISLPV